MKYYLLSLLILIQISCSKKVEKEANEMDIFNWLVGEWMDSTFDGKLVETWNRIDDSSFVGSSIYMSGIDTISYEEISLKKKSNKIYYIPSVQNQNDGKPVYFELTSTKNNEFVFENEEHDYPKKIVYTNPQKDSLVAYIDGPSSNGNQKRFFRMHRVNN